MSLDVLGCQHEVSRPSNSSVSRGVVMQERRAYMMKTDVEGEYYAVKVVFFGELTASVGIILFFFTADTRTVWYFGKETKRAQVQPDGMRECTCAFMNPAEELSVGTILSP